MLITNAYQPQAGQNEVPRTALSLRSRLAAVAFPPPPAAVMTDTPTPIKLLQATRLPSIDLADWTTAHFRFPFEVNIEINPFPQPDMSSRIALRTAIAATRALRAWPASGLGQPLTAT